MTSEALIIGSGPGGATAAEVLTRAGWSVRMLEKGRNHLLDPDDMTKPGRDYSNDEIKFISRYFLGPDPLIEPRAFRRVGGRRRAHARGRGQLHPDHGRRRRRARRRQGAPLPRGGLPPALGQRAPGGRPRRRLAARVRRARALLRRGGAGHRRVGSRRGQPVRRLAQRSLPDATRCAHVRRSAVVGRRGEGGPPSLRGADRGQQHRLRRPARLQQLRLLRVLRVSDPRQGRPGGPPDPGHGDRAPGADAGDLCQPDPHRGAAGDRGRVHRRRRARPTPCRPTW